MPLLLHLRCSRTVRKTRRESNIRQKFPAVQTFSVMLYYKRCIKKNKNRFHVLIMIG